MLVPVESHATVPTVVQLPQLDVTAAVAPLSPVTVVQAAVRRQWHRQHGADELPGSPTKLQLRSLHVLTFVPSFRLTGVAIPTRETGSGLAGAVGGWVAGRSWQRAGIGQAHQKGHPTMLGHIQHQHRPLSNLWDLPRCS